MTLTTPLYFRIDSINDRMYYNNKDLFEYDPEFYYGCKTKPRSIIQKRKIPETEIVYANLKMNEWKLSSVDCKKAQLLLSKEWVDKNYFKINTKQDIKEDKDIKQYIDEEEEQTHNIDEDNKQNIEEIETLEKAPSILNLRDDEKFKDSEGNILEIETRGEKNRNKIYFKVKDIMKSFEMPNLDSVLFHKDKGYERNVDYKTFFIRVKPANYQSHTIKKQLYLTYHGLLRVLFVSRNKQVKQFQDWAEEKLFTIQMGSKEEKEKLSYKLIKSTFDTHASKFPSIYLFKLGNVLSLRDTFKIDNDISDDSNIYKFGCTDDLARRTGELGIEYNKLENVDIQLSKFHIIDYKYRFDAENEIRELCKVFVKGLKTEGFNELIILNKEEYKYIEKYYKRIGTEYAGATIELQNKIKDLEMTHKNDLLEKELIIQKMTYENNTLKKQLETNEIIYNLKLQLASNK